MKGKGGSLANDVASVQASPGNEMPFCFFKTPSDVTVNLCDRGGNKQLIKELVYTLHAVGKD